jgi:hypothetical protein
MRTEIVKSLDDACNLEEDFVYFVANSEDEKAQKIAAQIRALISAPEESSESEERDPAAKKAPEKPEEK